VGFHRAGHRCHDANLGGIGNVRFQPIRLSTVRGHDPNNASLGLTRARSHIELTSDASSYDPKLHGLHASARVNTDRPSAEPSSANTPSKLSRFLGR